MKTAKEAIDESFKHVKLHDPECHRRRCHGDDLKISHSNRQESKASITTILSMRLTSRVKCEDSDLRSSALQFSYQF